MTLINLVNISWESSDNGMIETCVDNFWRLYPRSWAVGGEQYFFLVSHSKWMTS